MNPHFAICFSSVQHALFFSNTKNVYYIYIYYSLNIVEKYQKGPKFNSSPFCQNSHRSIAGIDLARLCHVIAQYKNGNPLQSPVRPSSTTYTRLQRYIIEREWEKSLAFAQTGEKYIWGFMSGSFIDIEYFKSSFHTHKNIK